MELAAAAFSMGWASGVNAWATVLVLGLWGRFTGADSVPEALQRTDVLIAAGVLFAIEAVGDKIPYVDSVWDLVSTPIRPTIGALLGLSLGVDSSGLEQALLGVAASISALASHSVKSGLRLAVNASPEPFTNATISLGEDLTVAGVVSLAVVHPWWAFGIASVLLIAGVTSLVLVWRWIRRGLARIRHRPEPTDRPLVIRTPAPPDKYRARHRR